MTSCPNCGHPPIRHVQDGLRHDCAVCVLLATEAAINNPNGHIPPVCHVRFNFRLSEREREQATVGCNTFEGRVRYMDMHPRHAKCAVCFCDWQEHMGYLCPSGDSVFVLLLESKLPYLHNA